LRDADMKPPFIKNYCVMFWYATGTDNI